MVVRIGFLGCGAVNFGGAEGPWDHASRLERMDDVELVGIADPLVQKAEAILEQRRQGLFGHMYKKCKIFDSAEKMLEAGSLDVVFIGIPPGFRGSMVAGRQVELKFVSAGVHCFVEKPLSVLTVPEFQPYADAVRIAGKKSGALVSVGYMFRYHPAVLKMKQLVSEHGGEVMAVNARYYLAYSQLDHPHWWNIEQSGGPIVEQATHFCDLARYFGGDVDLPTVQVTTLPASHPTGQLRAVTPGMEDNLSPSQKPPRVTSAQWRFTNGGVGSLMHAMVLHGRNYETHFDVLMDGLRLTLSEPYFDTCKLVIRRSGSEEDEVIHFPDSDMYRDELTQFLDAVRSKKQDGIRSSYDDAAKTYQFTRKIRDQS